MSNPQSLQLIICTFDGAEKADAARETIEALDARLDAIKLGNIAVIRKDADGRIVFHETADRPVEVVSTAAGIAVKGVTWLLYNIAGMLGPIAGSLAGDEAKAVVETIAPDVGFPDDALRDIGARLDAGQSALITLVEPEAYAIVVSELERLGGQLVGHALPEAVVTRLSGQSPS